jgi:hypothetical protein
MSSQQNRYLGFPFLFYTQTSANQNQFSTMCHIYYFKNSYHSRDFLKTMRFRHCPCADCGLQCHLTHHWPWSTRTNCLWSAKHRKIAPRVERSDFILKHECRSAQMTVLLGRCLGRIGKSRGRDRGGDLRQHMMKWISTLTATAIVAEATAQLSFDGTGAKSGGILELI